MRSTALKQTALTALFAVLSLLAGSALAFAKSTARPPGCSNTKCQQEGTWTGTCPFRLNWRCVQYSGNDCQTEMCPL